MFSGGVTFRFNITVDTVDSFKEKKGCTYSIYWKRGSHKGESKFAVPSNGMIFLKYNIPMSSKMKKSSKTSGEFGKKDINFTLREHSAKKVTELGTGSCNLSHHVNEKKEVIAKENIKLLQKLASVGVVRLTIKSVPPGMKFKDEIEAEKSLVPSAPKKQTEFVFDELEPKKNESESETESSAGESTDSEKEKDDDDDDEDEDEDESEEEPNQVKMLKKQLEDKNREIEDLLMQLHVVKQEHHEDEHSTKTVSKKFKKEKEILEEIVRDLRSKLHDVADSAQKVVVLTKELKMMQEREKQRYVLDSAILLCVPKTTDQVPESVSILHKSLKYWHYEQDPTYPTNVVRSIEQVVNVSTLTDNVTLATFWIVISYHLLSLLKKEDPETFKVLDKVIDRYTCKLLEKPRKVAPNPIDMTLEEDRALLPEEFVPELGRVLSVAYYFIIRSAVEKIDVETITQAVFDPNDENAKAKSSAEGGRHMREILKTLELFEKLLVRHKVEPRVIQHFFTALAKYIDAVVFNQLIKDAKRAKRAVQMKMALNILEQWFERPSIGIESMFKLTRQSADVCTIGLDALLSPDMHEMVCPDLTEEQIRHLLSLLDGRTLNAKSLSVDPVITLVGPQRHNLFDLDVEMGTDMPTDIRDRCIQAYDLEFLNE
jgi:chemotaxis protein histidine kinase CheA